MVPRERDRDQTHQIDGSQDPAHVIFRTRPIEKERFSGSFNNTIRLDLDLFKAQFVVPFRVAAVRLGVCETALKNLKRVTFSNTRINRTDFRFFNRACRKLGIGSWPYRKAP
jgi:hypothetical protein